MKDNLDKHIDDKLKKSAEQQTAKAPAFLWSSIAANIDGESELDTLLDQKIKHSDSEIKPQKAPEKIWLVIQRQLNIDKTWTKIEAKLSHSSSTKIKDIRLLGTIVFAIICLLRTCSYSPTPSLKPPVKLANNNNENKANPVNNNEANRAKEALLFSSLKYMSIASLFDENQGVKVRLVEQVNHTKSSLIGSNSNTKSNQNKGLKLKFKSTVSITEKQRLLAAKQIQSIKKSNQSPLISKASLTTTQQQTKISLPTDIKQIMALSAKSKGDYSKLAAISIRDLAPKIRAENKLQKQASKAVLKASKFKIGVFLVANATMLLNQETKDGFSNRTQIKNKYGFAANYGLWAAYQFLPKSAFVLEYSITAENKQIYDIYYNGRYYTKEWLMKYNRLSLAYQHCLGQQKSSKVVFQIGAYVGLLQEAKLFYNGNLYFNAIAEHQTLDFGLKISLGQELEFDSFVLGYGLRSDIGFANIFKGNKTISAQENYTNLLQLGGYVTLGYKF